MRRSMKRRENRGSPMPTTAGSFAMTTGGAGSASTCTTAVTARPARARRRSPMAPSPSIPTTGRARPARRWVVHRAIPAPSMANRAARAAMLGIAVLSGGMLAACGGTSSANEPAPAATGAADASARAKVAFASYVAKLLNVQPGEIRGGPADNTGGNHTRGAARHYTMWPVRDPASSIRGWVTPDGAVITPEQNLGVLFLEAGVWAKPPTQPLGELAGLLAGDII